jgi:hypothetical protein
MLTTSEVALMVAVVALLGTAVTVIQKRFADRRDAWWNRTQWALERIIAGQEDDDTQAAIGFVVLNGLQASRLATKEERDMLEAVADVALWEYSSGQP